MQPIALAVFRLITTEAPVSCRNGRSEASLRVNSAGIDADLMCGFGKAATVARQAAGRRELAELSDRR